MRILSLTINNFKGVNSLCLKLNGKNATIFGDNATGKTTIADAFYWLLFDKDSTGATSFEIKTLGADGKAVPMLNHSVESLIDINGEQVMIGKTYREIWTKKRGRADRVFDGHETIYHIAGVSKTKGEYQKFIDSIADERVFRILTNPTFFNKQLKWQDRRQILFGSFGGGVTDADVIANNKDLEPLAAIISTRSIDDVKKVAMAERKKINEELITIPSRIDEASRAIQDVPESAESLMVKAKKLAGDIEQLNRDRIQIENGGSVAKMRNQLAEVDGWLITMRNKHAAAEVDVSAEQEGLNRLSVEEHRLLIAAKSGEEDAGRLKAREGQLLEQNRDIVAMYNAKMAEQFYLGGVCPTCGQDYPESMVDVFKANFNRDKSAALERILADGNANRDRVIAIRLQIASLEEKAQEDKIKAGQLSSMADELKKQIESKLASRPAVEELPEWKELQGKKDELETSISAEQAGQGNSVNAILDQIDGKQTELNQVNQSITAIDSAHAQKQRIYELKSRERELAGLFEQQEKTLYLIEQFILTKVGMLTDSINSQFGLVRWKLFDEQVNGGLSETCICTVGGVPYNDINSAGQIQAGLDIIRTMSVKEGFTPPVFIDNRESIVSIPEMDCQIINLVVSEQDKELRVETI